MLGEMAWRLRSHVGDSEFITIDVHAGATDTDWTVTRVFLSAHCFGRDDDDCRWFEPDQLDWLEGHPSSAA